MIDSVLILLYATLGVVWMMLCEKLTEMWFAGKKLQVFAIDLVFVATFVVILELTCTRAWCGGL